MLFWTAVEAGEDSARVAIARVKWGLSYRSACFYALCVTPKGGFLIVLVILSSMKMLAPEHHVMASTFIL
jgi:hypothetical protein